MAKVLCSSECSDLYSCITYQRSGETVQKGPNHLPMGVPKALRCRLVIKFNYVAAKQPNVLY